MLSAVVIETPRLRLRQFTLEDADALEQVLGDPIAMEWYPSPFSREGVEDWIRKNIERYDRDGHSLWAMVLKSTGETIGDCGCAIQEVDGRREIEIGYHVRRDLWGNGYATEAAAACMQYAFDKLSAERVISMIRPGNRNSRRVAEKNGLTCEKIVFWHGFDHCIYTKNAAIST
jgi:RimJ/RimL family protein N-acetyltransferase